ncbi:hypothetical protein QQ020_25105 [Fulvivirgaceae bacterium BMA12]|uniref:Uncharacterized protein n=1 Tax=Agaribacillus aureus TaxID=3051825 RepID=A0ABT8LC69_9BACT|nr:hypothetical protein [Fulvivirgaceae bacterium BMA12]
MEKSINVLNKLASALDRRDETPNQQLAEEIVTAADDKAVDTLIRNLANNNKAIQNDCIKVLYEVGERKPSMIAGHMNLFLSLLNHKYNRLQWGAMTALNCIANVNPQGIYNNLVQIADAADRGSVITRDHAVNILVQLMGIPEYTANAFGLLIELLLKSPANQLPMYAEKALPSTPDGYKADLIKALRSRLTDIEKASKRARVEKVIKKLI